jgi:hypothetical protein
MPRHWHHSQLWKAPQMHQPPLPHLAWQDPSQALQGNHYSKVVCKVQPKRGDNTDQTRIIIGVNNIAYLGDKDIPTGSIKLVKLLINSVFSQRNAQIAIMDLKNFYLNAPLDQSEHVCIKLTDIPPEFIDKYKLNNLSATPGFILKCILACAVSPRLAS